MEGLRRSGLRANDAGIMIVALVAMLLTVQQGGGSVALEEAWSESHGDPTGSTYRNGHIPDASEKLPAPLVVDVDGDGLKEIVFVTREPTIEIVQVSGSTGKHNDGWLRQARTLANASLLSPAVSIRTGRQAVALGSGYVSNYDSRVNRRQVIAVVTEAWNVLCFDHTLKKLWERPIPVPSETHDMFLGEVSVLITPHVIMADDAGMVLVGGKLHHREHSIPPRRYSEGTEGGDAEWTRAEEDEDHSETVLDDGSHGSLKSEEVVYYALDGGTGEVRWSHEAGDWQTDPSSHDLLHPQHGTHRGEVNWKYFRHSLMDSLPHSWSSRSDTAFELARFERRRSGRDRQTEIARQKEYFVNEYLTLRRPHSESEHVAKPNALVAHVKGGIEVLHLYTGRSITRLSLAPGMLHADINGDGVIDHLVALSGETGHHDTHGTLGCTVLATSDIPAIYNLFNGSICPASVTALLRPFSHRVDGREGPAEVLAAASLVLPELPTWSILGSSRSTPLVVPGRDGSADSIASAVGQQKIQDVASWHRSNRPHRSMFLVNSGYVTSYSSSGQLLWQTPTGVRWGLDYQNTEAVESSLDMLSIEPSLTALHVKEDQTPTFVLATAARTIAVLDTERGGLAYEAELPHGSVSRVTLGDFTNDGLTDIIVTTTKGYRGYRLKINVGVRALTVLMLVLLFFLALVLAFKVLQDDDEEEDDEPDVSHFRNIPTSDGRFVPMTKVGPGDGPADVPPKPRRAYFGQRSRFSLQQKEAGKQS